MILPHIDHQRFTSWVTAQRFGSAYVFFLGSQHIMGLSMVNCDSCDGLVFSYWKKRRRYRMESERSTPYSHS